MWLRTTHNLLTASCPFDVQVEDVVEDLARHNPQAAHPSEVRTVKLWAEEGARRAAIIENMYRGSHVGSLAPPGGSALLTQPVWDSSLMREMLCTARTVAAAAASLDTAGGGVSGGGNRGGGGSELLRVAMPAPLTEAVTGGGAGAGFTMPSRHRHPRQFDRMRVPQASPL